MDPAAIWELRDLGFGTAAERPRRSRLMWQAQVQRHTVIDRFALEGVAAQAATSGLAGQIRITESAIHAAEESLRRSRQRIPDGASLPLAAIRAINALVDRRVCGIRAVVEHNRAPSRLLRAIGTPPPEHV